MITSGAFVVHCKIYSLLLVPGMLNDGAQVHREEDKEDFKKDPKEL